MSIEDRVRAATRARTHLVTGIRPLELPDELPARTRQPRLARRWNGWLIPLAAAVAVVAVAATLVLVRDLPRAAPAPATGDVGPARLAPGPWPPAAVNGVPGYYVSLGSDISVKGGGLIVGDAFTGRVLATVPQPVNARFAIVAGAGDGRTFVADALTDGVHPDQLWYLLRIAPGTASQFQLTRLPIDKDHDALILGLALSPDGRTLAVMDLPNGLNPDLRPQPNSPPPAQPVKVGALTLRTYAVSTGQPLRTWTRPWSGRVLPGNENYANLSWLADGHTLAFEYPLGTLENFTAKSSFSVLTLDTAGPGANLTGNARLVFHTPADFACTPGDGLLSPDGRTFFCVGSADNTPASGPPASGKHSPACPPESVTVTAYSTTPGKPERLLYQRSFPCRTPAVGTVAWAGPGGSAIAVIQAGSVPGTPAVSMLTAALMSPAELTPLKISTSATVAIAF